MAELTVTVAVLGGAAIAVTVKPSDSGDASSPSCRDTSRCLLPPPFSPSVLCSSFFTSVSPPGFSFFFLFPFFLLLCSPLFFLFLSLSLSVALPFFCRFSSFSPFLSCVRVVFIGAGGARSTLPRPIIARAWCARRLLCHGAGHGGQWRRCLWSTVARASHHEMGGV